MHRSKEQLYQEIKDIKSKDEFEKEIDKIQEEYDRLLDEDTTALLIVDKLGRNKQNISKINELEPGMECTIFGKITNITKSRNFNRKNGSTGQVINLELTDDTGACRLALWDRDVELVKKKTIQKGTNVKIINGYIKDGFNGIEINVGRWGLIEIEPEDRLDIKKEKTPEDNVLRGKIIEIEPTRAFFKDDGEFGFVTNIKLETKVDVKQITIWGEKVKEIQKLKQGNSIEIENIDIKQKNGKEELHVNNKGVIKKL
jgi:replication factor A1